MRIVCTLHSYLLTSRFLNRSSKSKKLRNSADPNVRAADRSCRRRIVQRSLAFIEKCETVQP